jgi:hypothetical protein
VQSSLDCAYVAWRKVSTAGDPDAYMRRILINLINLINAHARRYRRKLN